MSTSSSSSENHESESRRNPKIYDVFLSFKDEDTRAFTSHLYTFLTNGGVYVFIDDESPSSDEGISSTQLQAIQGSRISIIVLSENYAGSRRCMDELQAIIWRWHTMGQEILPVFYGVEPFVVRYPRGVFGAAFEDLIRRMPMEKDKEGMWRTALTSVADIGGFLIKDFRTESEEIKHVVLYVNRILCNIDLFTTNHPMGVGFEEVLPRMGGKGELGKTTTSIYDVFLNFRGVDTRAFTPHFYTYLENAGINVFRVDDKILGKNIPHTLMHAIEHSKISVIIFSKNYATSRWCLQELVKIMECRRSIGQVVLPVFYGVEPSEVLSQRSVFGEGFEELIIRNINMAKDEELSWRTALSDAASIPGLVMTNFRNESEVMENIVESVAGLLDKSTHLFIAKHPVGVESRVHHVIQVLSNQQPKDVLLLGIWGQGGIGKTTIAKAIYNHISCHFEGSSFLPNIKEAWEQDNNRIYLQEQLLSDVYRTKAKIRSIESGKIILKERLQCKRVLLVLDNMNKLDQMDALCGSCEWFGPSSIIILTTRDEHLLRMLKVDHVYGMKEMDEIESIELFSWHAFRQASPREDFVELARNIVAYCGGLPLTLVVLGSYLFNRRITEWKSVLQKLNIIPCHEVKKKLKLSFDGLSDDTKKEIFLNIACFFIGMNKNEVIQILSGYGLSAEIGMNVLVEQSLITVSQSNKLEMHFLLQDMGREIFRERSRKELGPRMRIFDVFLSFRGKDTRAGFSAHLHTALENARVYVFKDDDAIPKGEQISSSLLLAIEGSTISVIVISTNYVDSKWCLQELEKIIECHRTTGQVIVPVFYGVDPFEVRHLTGKFGQAFKKFIKRFKVQQDKELSWRTALHEVGGKAGFVIKDSKNESKDIKDIVEHITRLLDRTDLFIVNHPVGVESRVEDVIQLLNTQQSKDVLLLGIWGLGGIGKTTIAKAVYNKIGYKFEGRSFLLNIREVWENDNGQVYLQEQLLFDIYKTTKSKIHCIESGKMILKEGLRHKKILLVLDDINKLEQLNALSTSRDWFGPGSTIIITTRDEHLLKVFEVDHVYEVKEMNESESIELFSWHAFKQASPKKDFVGISRDVIAYSGRLPLALEVLGSYLFDRGIKEWNSVLEQVKIIPNNEVQTKLKISFDGLSDDPHDTKKEIFLDIACFFIGMDRSDVTLILNGCGLFADIGISVLIERSLVTVDSENRLGMHYLLRDMGREIIREKSPKEPEERSRLWLQKDVLDVLSQHIGTKYVEGLALTLPRDKTMCLSTEAFENMKRLRLLQLAGVKLDGDFKYISRDLRWLYWHGFPLAYTPTDFYQGNLVAIELEYSNLELMWRRPQLLEKLKILNLSHSHYLKQSPNFSYLPNLEKLVLEDCPFLSTVCDTIGQLNKLLLINLKDCIGLHDLPRSIYNLKSLKTLILSGCLKIDKLEEDLEQMKSLTTLIADKTAITQVPSAVIRSKSIGYISLCGFEGLSRDVFPSIRRSWMSPTNNLVSRVQTFVGMSSLVSTSVPDCSSHGMCLQVSGDSEGISEAMPTTSEVSNTEMFPSVDFHSQILVSKSKDFLNSLLIQMGMNCQVTNTLRESILQKLTTIGPSDCLLPDDNDPDWQTFNGEGSSVSFEVPQVNGRNLKTMMLCILYSTSTDIATSEDGLRKVHVINDTKNTSQVFGRDALTSFEEGKWQSIISNLEPGDKVEVRVDFGNGFILKNTVVYLIHDEEKEHCHAPDKDVIVSDGDENRFRGLPSLLRAVLVSQPFWFGLAAVLVWSRCRLHK